MILSSTPPLHIDWREVRYPQNFGSRFARAGRSPEAALKALEGFRLDAVVQKVECPFLLVHGEGNAQIPLADAQRCFDAVGSRQKIFKVFTRDEGGYHHCQEDNTMIGIAYMWDWLEDVLQPTR